MKRRRDEKTIYGLTDTDGVMQTTHSGIALTFTTFLQEKYDRIVVDAGSIQFLDVITSSQRSSYKVALDNIFDHEEIYQAIRAGGRRNVPGIDGIGREIYIRSWELIRPDMSDILNQMVWVGCITPNQKIV
jgi:hypothetical protein